MNKLLRLLGVLLAAVLVFAAARFLDNGPAKKSQPEVPASASAEDTRPVMATEPVGSEVETETAETAAAETEAGKDRFLLTFVGDCTLGCRGSHSYNEFGYLKVIGEDYGYPFRKVIDYFENDEFTFINLEGTITDVGNAVKKAHTFRGPSSYVNILTENSVEGVSLANNHTMDYTKVGYDATKANLEAAGVPYVERDSATVFTTENGLTIGIYGAVYYLLDQAAITEAITELRQQADIVVFAPHWGTEKSYKPLKTQIDLAHAAIDAGADIVYGCHPHVLQPIEEYNGGVIYYSLGNFSFGGNIYPEDYDSALIQQEIIRGSDGTISLGETITVPVCISGTERRNDYQPVPYAEDSEDYRRVLAKLDGTWK